MNPLAIWAKVVNPPSEDVIYDPEKQLKLKLRRAKGTIKKAAPKKKELPAKLLPDRPHDGENLFFEYGLELTWDMAVGYEDTIKIQVKKFLSGHKWKKVFGVNRPPKPHQMWIDDLGGDCEYVYKNYFKKLLQEKYKSPIEMGTKEIEIHTDPIGSMKELLTFYSNVKADMDTFGIPIESKEETGGGAHLHVNIKNEKFTKELMLHIFHLFAKYPFLNWVFNHPFDDVNADSLHCKLDVINNSLKQRSNQDGANWHHAFNTGKGYGLNFCNRTDYIAEGDDHSTLEFRIFDMPFSVEEQRLHIEFVEHWLVWAICQYEAGVEARTNPKDITPLMGMTYEEAEEKFKLLCKVIGLNVDDYEVFIHRNLFHRFAWDLPRT